MDGITTFLGIVLLIFFRLAWAVRSAVIRVSRLSALGIDEYGTGFIFGNFFPIIKMGRQAPENLSLPSYFLPVAIGLTKLYKTNGMFRLNVGLLKQVVVIYSEDGVKDILSDNREVDKSSEYNMIQDFLGSGLLNSPHKKWIKQRRLLSPAFQPRIIQEVFHPIMNDKSHIMVEKIRARVATGEPVGVEETVALCILDIITETAMGVKIGAQEGGYVPYLNSLHKILKLMTKRILSPWLWPDFLFRLTPSGRELRRHLQVVHSFVKDLIPIKKDQLLKEREEGFGKQQRRRPFLELMLLHNMNCIIEEDMLSEQEIEDHTHTFTFGGSDTVTHTIYWTIYYMGLYPEVMKQAYEEIDAIFNGDKERPITVEDLKHMDYIERIIKETMRLTPTVPLVIRELSQDFTINKVRLPKGTTVAVFFFALHMDPKVFPNPEIFDPDRFLESKISPYAFTPFSAGPRGCIGKLFAMLELKTIMADLVRNFSWSSLDHRDVVLPCPDIVTRPHLPLNIVFANRD